MAILNKLMILDDFLWQIRIPDPKISKIDHSIATTASLSGFFTQKGQNCPRRIEDENLGNTPDTNCV